MSENLGHPIQRFVSLALIVIGVLWIGASGLCTAAFFVSLFVEGEGDFREALSIVPMILLVGGISAAVGIGVYALGRTLRPKP